MVRLPVIETQLSVLSFTKQLAFGLLAVERMFPSLMVFSKDTHFDASSYLQGKDAAWGMLHNKAVGHAIRQACAQNAPDTERYSHELTSQALNAALAISELLTFSSDCRTDHLRTILTLIHDSIYLYLSNLELSIASSQAEDDMINSHLLMQQERRREEEDIDFLSALPDVLDQEVISSLRDRASMSPPLLPLSQ